MNRSQQTIKSIGAEPDRNHPAYLHHLICQVALQGVPLVCLVSEPEPLTISLIAGTWHSLETIGEVKEEKISGEDKKGRLQYENIRHAPGTGHDCLVIQTPGGVETELTVAQTAELIDKLEILLGKKQPNIIVPSIVPPNLKM